MEYQERLMAVANKGTPVESLEDASDSTETIKETTTSEVQSYLDMAHAVLSKDANADIVQKYGVSGTIGVMVQMQKSDVPPLEIVVRDTDGKFSSKVLEFASNYGIHIVPAKLVKGVPKTIELNGYDTVDYDAELYFIPKRFNTDVMAPIISQAVKKLENGESYSVSLFKSFPIGIEQHRTLHISPKQLQDLYSTFYNFEPKVIKTDKDLVFCVGDFE
jgi:hypothetical protein